MSIREMLERRKAITTEMQVVNDQHKDAAFPDDVQRRWDGLKGDLDTLEQRISRQSVLDDAERRVAGTTLHGSGDDRFDALAARVTAVDVIRAQMGATDEAAGRAREVSAELERRSGRRAEGLLFSLATSGAPIEKRVFTTSSGGGSNLIATEVSPNLIDRLREKILVRGLGATVLGGLQGNLNIPRLSASATAAWVAENAAITPSAPTADHVGLTPKHVGGIVEMSRNMVQQPSLDVARMIENDLAQLIAVAIDQAALVGGGSNQPSGLLASGSGIGSVALGTNGAAPTWASIVNLISAVDVANALDGRLAFAGNGKVTSVLRRTLKTSADTSSNFLMTDASTLAGYPYASSQNVPSNLTKSSGSNLSALIFGDWSQLVIGFWSELDILVNPFESTAYSKGNVQVRAMATADVTIRQPLAFAAITDMVTT